MVHSPTTERWRILVIHDQSDPHVSALRTRFPSMDFHVRPSHWQLGNALLQLQPNIVLSFKQLDTRPEDMAAILEAPSVEWLHISSVGAEHIPARTGGPLISHVSGLGAPAMAEYAVGALMAANLRLPDYLRQQGAREWNILPWRSVRNRTILLIGLGWIGKEIARVAETLGMRVIGIKSKVEPVAHVLEVRPITALTESLAVADFVSLQVPLNGDTHHLIDAAALAAMKPDSWLINIGRGPLVDEVALIEALKCRRIAGAILDVFDREPLPPASPLWDLPNCIITPHCSGWTLDWIGEAYEEFAINLERRLRLEAPLRVLNR